MLSRRDLAHSYAWLRWCAIALLLALVCAGPILAAEPKFPALTGRVVDDAGILNRSTVSELDGMLARHEQATGKQVVVVTLPSLQGYSIEEFGYQLGRYWGIGQKDKNTGALLIVAPKEHKVRIEVGYGLEGKLTDAQSSVIIQRDILPQFRRGDFNAGVLAGTRSILTVLGGEPGSVQPTAAAPGAGISPAMIIFMLVAIWLLYVFLMHQMARNPRIIRRVGRSGYVGPGGFYSSRGGSWGGGGGGFSGGGGSFGGGGASGSW